MFFPYFMILSTILSSFRKDLIVCLSLFSQFSYSPHLLFNEVMFFPVCYTSSPPMFSSINLSLSCSPLLSHAASVRVFFFLEKVVVVAVKAAGRL
jgi:hypothetical protein